MSTKKISKKDLEYIQKFRLLDDDFMSKVFDDNPDDTQLVLNIILDREDLKVKSVTAQRELKTVLGHSVKLDVYAVDDKGKSYDIEIQRADKGASPQRARYNSSVLDTHLLEKGKDYAELKENFVIFITENDVLGKGLPLYHIERKILETDELFNDGEHIIFVNGQYDNPNDKIGKLMHDFRCTDAKDMFYKQLAETVNYFKNEERGSETMCKMMEDMRNEARKEERVENAKKMLSDNLSVEKVVEYSGLSLDEVIALKEKL